MEKTVKAQAKYIGRSAQKARLVADAVRGMPAKLALANLQYMPQGAAVDIYKVVASAIANGEHNMGLKGDTLVIKEIFIDVAPTFKRQRAESKGRGRRILKRNCHITVILGELASKSAPVKAEKDADAKPKAAKKPSTTAKKAVKKSESKVT